MSETNNDGKPISSILALYSESNVHTGTGQSTGAIDLPVDRERHTGFPVIASSGLKGALRQKAEEEAKNGSSPIKLEDVIVLFGPEVTGDGGHAGAISVSQANLLAFPVRSLTNVFQWVTCPDVLGRLERDLKIIGGAPGITSIPDIESGWFVSGDGFTEEEVILEDLNLKRKEANGGEIISGIADRLILEEGTRGRFANNALIVSNDDFTYFVKHTTEVRARIKLDENKTTSGPEGNLWYEETLPRDCLFYSLVRCMKPMDGSDNKVEWVTERFEELLPEGSYLRVGGNETVGMGWCSVKVYGGK